MSENRKKSSPDDAGPAAERRRVGTVVHDDRGNASVKWRAAREDEDRPVLELLGEGGLAVKSEEVSYDPYARHRPLSGRSGRRTDLRKLSEWIKRMRELEERKRTDDTGSDEE